MFDEAYSHDSEPPPKLPLPRRVEKVKWFLLPWEAWQYGHGNTVEPATKISFTPKLYGNGTPGRLNSVPTCTVNAGAANSVSATLNSCSSSEALNSVPAALSGRPKALKAAHSSPEGLNLVPVTPKACSKSEATNSVPVAKKSRKWTKPLKNFVKKLKS